jgi:phosphatidylglycerophosphate synthase
LHHLNLVYPDILFCVVVGGHSTFFALLNTFVHIIMYFYYMVSAMGPKYQKYIWWKKYLTTFQMVNFFALIDKNYDFHIEINDASVY